MTWIKTFRMEDDERVKTAMEAERKLYPAEYATPVPAVDRGPEASIVGVALAAPGCALSLVRAFGAMLSPELPLAAPPA